MKVPAYRMQAQLTDVQALDLITDKTASEHPLFVPKFIEMPTKSSPKKKPAKPKKTRA
jgi:hypothetical protein